MQSYVIHFIRHGLTEANLTGKYAGVWDIPVCSEGIEKLHGLKDIYKYPCVEEYYSSPLQRCIQTCDIVYPQTHPVVVEGLKECNFGDWEGKTTQELTGDELYLKWMNRGNDISPPNGESWSTLYNRIRATFERIVESMMRRKVTSASVFTHGGVIMTILAMYGIPRADFYEWMVDNGCGYSVRITPGIWMREKVMEVYDKIPLGANGNINGEFKNLIDNLKEKH